MLTSHILFVSVKIFLFMFLRNARQQRELQHHLQHHLQQ